jgi:protein AbiQ
MGNSLLAVRDINHKYIVVGGSMDWYVVDKKYIKYLTQFDSRVGYVEYGERLKLHIGILLTVGDFHYYVPISSAKPKHQKMSNSLDFHKLQDETSGYLYAVLNINNMIPVPDNCLTQLKYNQVENFRSFSNEKEKTNYIYLLQKEKALIDNVQNTIQTKALKLYQKCVAKPDSSLASRCCNFKMLEEKCSSYSGI